MRGCCFGVEEASYYQATMGRYSVKKYKTKRRIKDLDLIYDELSSQSKIQQLLNQPLDETKPGLGQHYCIQCAKYMETAYALKTHLKTKVHKRRVKDLKGMPYTQDVANAAAGVSLNKFLDRVSAIKDTIDPEKLQNEVLLKDHLTESLANIKTTEPTLPWVQDEAAAVTEVSAEVATTQDEVNMD